MSHLTITDINADRHLSVAIAATFAIAVYHLHNEKLLKDCLVKVLQWGNYDEDELLENYSSAYAAADRTSYSAAISTSCTSVVTTAATSARYAVASTTSSSSAASAISARYAADYAAVANHVRNGHAKLEIGSSLAKLLPLIVNYKVNRTKRPFRTESRVLDLLEGKYLELFIFNLDLLT